MKTNLARLAGAAALGSTVLLSGPVTAQSGDQSGQTQATQTSQADKRDWGWLGLLGLAGLVGLRRKRNDTADRGTVRGAL